MRAPCDKPLCPERRITQIQWPPWSIVKFLHRDHWNIKKEVSCHRSLVPTSPKYTSDSPCLLVHIPLPLQWSWNLVGGRVEKHRGPTGDWWSRRSELRDTNISHNRAEPRRQSSRRVNLGEEQDLSRGGGKKLFALCQTKNELFWPLYCGGYPMTIQYFHPGQRHVFWERFTMLAWAILHKLILQWKHTSATRIQWNCIIISVFSFQRLSDKPKL